MSLSPATAVSRSLVSIIICTYNPRRNQFQRVLDALRGQTLPLIEWELIIIDSKSEEGALDGFDLSWHPRARIVQAERPGLCAARITGIAEAQSDLLLFVDDDNVLDPPYLALALQYGREWPMLGAWGGQSTPEYESAPPAELAPFLYLLGNVQVKRSKWSNLDNVFWTTPIGAGMCVRKVVAEAWVRRIRDNPKLAEFGRIGTRLLSGEDWDMAMTSPELGLGTGIFENLHFTHLIKKERIDRDYLLRIAYGAAYSVALIKYHRGILTIPYLEVRLAERLSEWRLSGMARSMQRAQRLGYEAALKEIRRLQRKAGH